MDPLTITLLTVGVVGIAASAVGQSISAEAQYEAQKEQAKIAERNAELQVQQAEYNRRVEEREAAAVAAETAENARRQRAQSKALQASQRALLGKSGALMTSGSPLAVLGATAADEEIKIQDIHYSGARSYAEHLTKAADFGFQSSIAKNNILAAKASRPSGASLAGSMIGIAGGAATQVASLGLSAAKSGGGSSAGAKKS